MAKQLTITDIAKLAGVSAGTVDRILHRRGKVSERSRAAVEKVLAESGYRNNIHTSAVGLRKGFRIAVTMPASTEGGYWHSILEGISHATEEFSDISMEYSFFFYDRFDIYSCRTAFEGIPESRPDAVIIGPTFKEETLRLCSILKEGKIPYIFVDSDIPEAGPAASFTADQRACGKLAGKMLCLLSAAPPPHYGKTEYAILCPEIQGMKPGPGYEARKSGIMEFFSHCGLSSLVHEISVPVLNTAESERIMTGFMASHPQVRCLATMDSRGHVAADILSRHGISGISLLSFDLTSENRKCLQDGSISAVISLHPELQGYDAVKAAIHCLLYNDCGKGNSHRMPIDIIVAENLPYHRKIYTE